MLSVRSSSSPVSNSRAELAAGLKSTAYSRNAKYAESNILSVNPR